MVNPTNGVNTRSDVFPIAHGQSQQSQGTPSPVIIVNGPHANHEIAPRPPALNPGQLNGMSREELVAFILKPTPLLACSHTDPPRASETNSYQQQRHRHTELWNCWNEALDFTSDMRTRTPNDSLALNQIDVNAESLGRGFHPTFSFDNPLLPHNINPGYQLDPSGQSSNDFPTNGLGVPNTPLNTCGTSQLVRGYDYPLADSYNYNLDALGALNGSDINNSWGHNMGSLHDADNLELDFGNFLDTPRGAEQQLQGGYSTPNLQGADITDFEGVRRDLNTNHNYQSRDSETDPLSALNFPNLNWTSDLEGGTTELRRIYAGMETTSSSLSSSTSGQNYDSGVYFDNLFNAPTPGPSNQVTHDHHQPSHDDYSTPSSDTSWGWSSSHTSPTNT